MEIKNDSEEKVGQGGAIKTAANFLIILGIAIAVLFFLEKMGRIDLFNGDTEKENAEQTLKYYEELQEKYKNDNYGGSTPEETLKLFITALKAGDTELAAKYFVVEKQEEWKTALEGSKDAGNLLNYAALVEKASVKKYGKEIPPASYQFSSPTDQENLPWIISLELNSQTNKWKLESM